MKKTLSMLTVAAMICTIAGCGNNTVPVTSDTSTNTSSDATASINSSTSADDSMTTSDTGMSENTSSALDIADGDDGDIDDNADDNVETVNPEEMYIVPTGDDGFRYSRLETGGVRIDGLHMSVKDAGDDYDDWYMIYPLELGGSPVREAQHSTNWDDHIAYVEFEEGYTSIPARALQQAKGLKTVIIPDTVIEIGQCAFNYCESLTNVQLPDGLVYLGDRAFAHCNDSLIITYRDKVYTYDEIDKKDGLSQLQLDIIANNPDLYDADGNYLVESKTEIECL